MVASKNILGVPRCVALTDGDPLAVDLLKQNLQNPTNAIDQSMVKETRLLWGTDDTEGMSQFSKWCQTQWPELWPNNLQDDKNQQEENSSKTPSFDLIIAGDVLYKETLPLLFFQTVEALLDEDGTLWLCHVPRFNVTQEIVVDAATTAGFAMESHPLTDCDIPGCPLEDRERARIYRITKKLR
mgnify:CR=1 FL=1